MEKIKGIGKFVDWCVCGGPESKSVVFLKALTVGVSLCFG
jgi:hypothetical protein